MNQSLSSVPIRPPEDKQLWLLSVLRRVLLLTALQCFDVMQSSLLNITGKCSTLRTGRRAIKKGGGGISSVEDQNYDAKSPGHI